MPNLEKQLAAWEGRGWPAIRENKPGLTKTGFGEPVWFGFFGAIFLWCKNGYNLNFKGGGVVLGCVESPPSIKTRFRHGFVG